MKATTPKKRLARTALVALAGIGLTLLLQSFQTSGHTRRVLLLTPEQERILSHMSLVFLDDGAGNLLETIEISGVNVRIVNGLGTTNSSPSQDPYSFDLSHSNGLGNLIVGYNETRGPGETDLRSGSHNLVVGQGHNYTGFGGIVGGWFNASRGAYAGVTAGFRNRATGRFAGVGGGSNNEAGGEAASVSGGILNRASGDYSSVAAGERNEAVGDAASVSGGTQNAALGDSSSVGGGLQRATEQRWDWRAGGLFQDQ